MSDNAAIKKIVQDSYTAIARAAGCGCSCCGQAKNQAIAASIGYAAEDLAAVPEANLGLGCGNPLALGGLAPGETVLDLGSGAGFDAFLAAKKVGPAGRVIGVDLTPAMIEQAAANAAKYGFANVEFRLGDIERLPVDDAAVDVIISNCVINLAPDKAAVFCEAARALKPGGRLFVSDIVLLEELPAAARENEALIAGCVGGAILRDDYLALVAAAGLTVTAIHENPGISQEQYQGLPLESISIQAVKG